MEGLLGSVVVTGWSRAERPSVVRDGRHQGDSPGVNFQPVEPQDLRGGPLHDALDRRAFLSPSVCSNAMATDRSGGNFDKACIRSPTVGMVLSC